MSFLPPINQSNSSCLRDLPAAAWLELSTRGNLLIPIELSRRPCVSSVSRSASSIRSTTVDLSGLRLARPRRRHTVLSPHALRQLVDSVPSRFVTLPPPHRVIEEKTPPELDEMARSVARTARTLPFVLDPVAEEESDSDESLIEMGLDSYGYPPPIELPPIHTNARSVVPDSGRMSDMEKSWIRTKSIAVLP